MAELLPLEILAKYIEQGVRFREGQPFLVGVAKSTNGRKKYVLAPCEGYLQAYFLPKSGIIAQLIRNTIETSDCSLEIYGSETKYPNGKYTVTIYPKSEFS